MKDPAAVSPFAAQTRHEQQEQWIWWQCQRSASTAAESPRMEPPAAVPVPSLTLPTAPLQPPASAAPVQRRATHHGQYDAVIRRLRSATAQTGHYTSCASIPERQMQPSSGSENADA